MIGGFFKKSEEILDTDLDNLEPLADDSCRLTPEGFGFSSPASRILKQAGRKGGYYRASASQFVLDVIAAITDEKEQDVALVYDDNDVLLGIFTEADYIKVCLRQRVAIVHARYLLLSYFNLFPPNKHALNSFQQIAPRKPVLKKIAYCFSRLRYPTM